MDFQGTITSASRDRNHGTYNPSNTEGSNVLGLDERDMRRMKKVQELRVGP